MAQQIARGLVTAGVTEVVFAPGSRSAPLVYALAPLAEAGLIRTHVRVDERDAGFLALGLARGLRVKEARRRASADSDASDLHEAGERASDLRESGLREAGGSRGEAPVVLVTTSGSAVANLHPAVLEASYGHLPLLAITADRPARLRGTGANQTLDDQSQVLTDVRAAFDVAVGGGSQVGCGSELGRGTAIDRVVHDRVRGVDELLAEAIARSVGRAETGAGGERLSSGREQPAAGRLQDSSRSQPGPVQFNVQFDVPLVPTEDELGEWIAEIEEMTGAEESPEHDLGYDHGQGQDGGKSQDGAKSRDGGKSRPLDRGRIEVALPLNSTVGSGPTIDSEPNADSGPNAAAGPNAASGTSAGTIIVAGDAAGFSADQLIELAEQYGIPVLAEPSSPLTAARTFVPLHDRVLAERSDLRAAVRTVLVHGKPTLTRPVAALLADETVDILRLPDNIDEVELVLSGGAEADREGGENADDRPRSWLEEWTAAGSALASVPAPTVVAEITEYLAGSEITLFAASSNTVRYLSAVSEVKAEIHASRGLAGIDGLVSTAIGLSLALEDTVVLVIGDIALLHDVGGLLTPSDEQAGDVVIVVLNDDGGAIFSGLEHSQNHVTPYLQRYFTVGHGMDFSDLATAYGWDYSQASSFAEFVTAIEDTAASAGAHRRIIEITLEPLGRE